MAESTHESKRLEKRLDEAIKELDTLRSQHSHLKLTVLSQTRTIMYLRIGVVMACVIALRQEIGSAVTWIARSVWLIVFVVALFIFWFFLPSLIKKRK